MSHEVASTLSLSSDESDTEKLLKSDVPQVTPKLKSPNGVDCKTCSSDSGDVVNICSESGSEKESCASRDSDSSASVSCYTLPSRKRKTTDKSWNKASDSDSSSKVFVRDTVANFMQEESCSKLSKCGKFFKCRECFKSADTNRYDCRFYSFRKMRLSKTNIMYEDGFATSDDATQDDRNLWLPKISGNITDDPCELADKDHLDFHVARFILSQVGDQFCNLMRQEEEAIALHMVEEDGIVWKKPMKGVREMCDVCKTTLFNFHWACDRCGFVVCIDCYKVRKSGLKKGWMVKGPDADEWKWLNCTNRQPHEQDTLMLCQAIAGDCLKTLGQLLHEVREILGIPKSCQCSSSSITKSISGLNMDRLKELTKSDPVNAIISHLESQPRIVNGSEEHEARVILEAQKQKLPDETESFPVSLKQEDSDSDSDDDGTAGQSGLLSLLVPSNVVNGVSKDGNHNGSPLKNSPLKQSKVSNKNILDDCLSSLYGESKKVERQYFVRRNNASLHVSQNQLPPRMMTKAQSEKLYPGVPHAWLCDGWLLRLVDPSHSGNYKIFQDQWKRGQPVIVGNMIKLLNVDLWHPNSFCRDFGEDRNDLINCATGNLVPNRPMKEFWEGFENSSKRLKDEQGNPMLLKLKDWPPGQDFAELLPERFNNLMQALPLAEYTRRTGRLNLASCLPDFFVCPDLGPKMYNAYGSALFPTKGTTNLHLDISDAVNFMVYVGIPTDSDSKQHIKEAFNAIDEAGCDDMTRRRVRLPGVMPGALWHIYHACDADKIRDLLNKVAVEKKTRLEPHHDPIHDQSWYLDAELRKRLYREYNVSGYAIVQCLGDAVFIPAGAPHQVRNLHNCVKVAEDFVSPENVSHCFHLTQEFRDLSDTHTNHEDKLQIKNIIYHTIKSAVQTLLREVTDSEPSTEKDLIDKTDTEDMI